MEQEAPKHWLEWVDDHWNQMEPERLRIGLMRMVVYADDHGLYYWDGETKRPFREKIVDFVKRKAREKSE